MDRGFDEHCKPGVTQRTDRGLTFPQPGYPGEKANAEAKKKFQEAVLR
jgi:hypothetical protein